ncbi:hypothetical protein AMAG_03233 [Allomyces macrogynus ATCC 38327]|uniref:holo-[acyl-carrier-protein] synthase n=1 Tax=Allomyces macrogynus (strain ATCC 38327) TaxID=578462 RepID=A0A0L0S547_ALLM3|nr:hypothetical protein AMAG_03233 [Allomyces macrogynus ATCC 38327]|eukprot:KNE57531.1 hypothetical protein AMAG_03233 [Allomyces macrogynus ATCC 38327]
MTAPPPSTDHAATLTTTVYAVRLADDATHHACTDVHETAVRIARAIDALIHLLDPLDAHLLGSDPPPDSAEILHCTPDWESARIRRQHRALDRLRTATGAVLVRYAVALATSGEGTAIVRPYVSTTGKLGKPRVHPSTASIHFNLSHHAQWVVLAVSRHPVGIDVTNAGEMIMNTRRGAAHAEIAAMYGPLMGDQEAPVILDKARDAARAFAFAWAAKEAVTKAWGVGVAVAADAVLRAVQLLDPPEEVEGTEGVVADGWRQARDYAVVVNTHHDAVVAHGGPDAVGTPIAVQLFEEVGTTRGDAVAVALMRPRAEGGEEGDEFDEVAACRELDRESIAWVTMSLVELIDRVRELVASDTAGGPEEEEEES